MDKNKNYYKILGVEIDDDANKIKKAYYKLSFKLHPDKNQNPEDNILFLEAKEAYDVLKDDSLRNEYDKKSKYGRYYDEFNELYDTSFDYSWNKYESKLKDFKRNEINDIVIEVDPELFDGTILYERWVVCKKCGGLGKDLDAKIEIKDSDGNVNLYESADGCDFCEGTGKDHMDNKCTFCLGEGRVGTIDCSKCKGEKRTYGKQKIKNIKLTGEKTQLKSLGNYAKNGKVGDLFIIKKA